MELMISKYSGSQDSWIVDTFNHSGEFKSSENYNLAQILNEETSSQLDFNYDGHRGNKVEERYGNEKHIIKSKVCIRMKLWFHNIKFRNSKEFIFRSSRCDSSKRKNGDHSLFEFSLNPSSAYRIDELSYNGAGVPYYGQTLKIMLCQVV